MWAILADGGVAVVEPAQRAASHAWLARHGYAVSTVDFAGGIGAGATALGELFRWEEQFGYRYGGDRLSLDALRDGSGHGFDPERGNVLELLAADVAHDEDPEWMLNLLAVAHEYRVHELAGGRRFFAVLVLERNAALIGAAYETKRVPRPFVKGLGFTPPFE